MSMLYIFPAWTLLIAITERPRRARIHRKRQSRFDVIKTAR